MGSSWPLAMPSKQLGEQRIVALNTTRARPQILAMENMQNVTAALNALGVKTCLACGKAGAKSLCMGCRSVSFCGKACQRGVARAQEGVPPHRAGEGQSPRRHRSRVRGGRGDGGGRVASGVEGSRW